MRTTTHLAIVGPFDLREIALMGFGHRDERSFDGVALVYGACCLDGGYERQVGVAARRSGDRLELRAEAVGDPLSDTEVELCASRLPGWSHSTTTARHFTSCASPTRCYPECMLERQDSNRPCSPPRTGGCLVDHQRAPGA